MNLLKHVANECNQGKRSLYVSLDFPRETLFKNQVRSHCSRALSCLSILPLKEEEKLLGKKTPVYSRTVIVDQESYVQDKNINNIYSGKLFFMKESAYQMRHHTRCDQEGWSLYSIGPRNQLILSPTCTFHTESRDFI